MESGGTSVRTAGIGAVSPVRDLKILRLSVNSQRRSMNAGVMH
jgi:hypothetical protein